MAKRLTAAGVERMRSGDKRVEVPDMLVAGLHLVVQPSGRKSWAFRYRLRGKTGKYTIGSWPAVGLADARSAAANAAKAVACGVSPLIAKREAMSNTVEAAVAEWLQRDQANNRTYQVVKRTFDRDVLSRWHGRPITSIGRHDCLEVIDAIVDRGAVANARRVYGSLHRFFRWSVGRGVLTVNPMDGLPKPGREVRRDRVLSDKEIAEVWHGANTLAWPFGPAIKLLLLTGARRDEIASVRWSEIDRDAGVIRLEGLRTKTGEPRTVPLSPPAMRIIEGLPRIAPENGVPSFVFMTTGKAAIAGWSRAKRRLDVLIAEARQKEAAWKAGGDPEQIEEFAAWRLHDLRRPLMHEAPAAEDVVSSAFVR